MKMRGYLPWVLQTHRQSDFFGTWNLLNLEKKSELIKFSCHSNFLNFIFIHFHLEETYKSEVLGFPDGLFYLKSIQLC